jgi:hypothetical protein
LEKAGVITEAGRLERRGYRYGALVIALSIAAYRLAVLASTPLGLYGDEAQYWVWAQAPAFGYFSKPPMIAWIIAATTKVCGDAPFCIRLASPLIHAATSLVVFLIAERLYGPRAGLWASAAFGLLPGVSFYAVAATTDTPLLFFWALSLYAFLRAITEDRWPWWLLTGAAVGLGLLSKYSMAAFVLSAFLYIVLTPAQRHHLLNPRAYVALMLAGLIYSPNLLWNLQHGLVSYQHTQRISYVNEGEWSLRGISEFFVAQFGVFGPIFFAVLLYLLVRGRARDDHRFLVSFIAPWLLIVSIVALLSRAYANWAIIVYVAGAVLVSGWLLECRRIAWLRASLAIHIATAGLFYHYDAAARVAGIELAADTDPFKYLRGWDTAGAMLTGLLRQYPGAALLSDQRMTTALLTYYARPATVVKWNPDGVMRDHFDLTTHMEDRIGRDFLFVTEKQGDAARGIDPYFRSVKPLPAIRVPIHRGFDLALNVYLMSGFKGYEMRNHAHFTGRSGSID